MKTYLFIICPNCGSTDFDGHDCLDCGFDGDCFDPNYD